MKNVSGFVFSWSSRRATDWFIHISFRFSMFAFISFFKPCISISNWIHYCGLLVCASHLLWTDFLFIQICHVPKNRFRIKPSSMLCMSASNYSRSNHINIYFDPKIHICSLEIQRFEPTSNLFVSFDETRRSEINDPWRQTENESLAGSEKKRRQIEEDEIIISPFSRRRKKKLPI